jgi:hypothetical protein
MRLNYTYQNIPKPCLHPIRLPSGTSITEYEPSDHVWHRGLWFTFKFVNGVNYWEERDPVFGYQRTEMYQETADTLTHTLRWEDETQGIPLTETRQLSFREHDDVLVIDWHTEMTATTAVTLDRTPFTTWGGYGGLFIRLRNDLTEAQCVFSDGTRTPRPVGERYQWGGIEGTLPEGDTVGVVFLPHTRNPRHPEPFYGSAKPNYNFLGAAPLFHEPLLIPAGETLTYRSRVLILPRRITASEVAEWLAQ